MAKIDDQQECVGHRKKSCLAMFNISLVATRE